MAAIAGATSRVRAEKLYASFQPTARSDDVRRGVGRHIEVFEQRHAAEARGRIRSRPGAASLKDYVAALSPTRPSITYAEDQARQASRSLEGSARGQILLLADMDDKACGDQHAAFDGKVQVEQGRPPALIPLSASRTGLVDDEKSAVSFIEAGMPATRLTCARRLHLRQRAVSGRSARIPLESCRSRAASARQPVISSIPHHSSSPRSPFWWRAKNPTKGGRAAPTALRGRRYRNGGIAKGCSGRLFAVDPRRAAAKPAFCAALNERHELPSRVVHPVSRRSQPKPVSPHVGTHAWRSTRVEIRRPSGRRIPRHPTGVPRVRKPRRAQDLADIEVIK
jgi:hypothetical protein